MINSRSSFSWTTILITIALLAPFFFYFPTAISITEIWNASETFAHGYIILPISLWLIWQRKNVLAQMSPLPYSPALFGLAACGFGWLLAELADVQVVRQYMLVFMVPFIVITVLGWRIAWSMAFPLFFLVLAVPFGDVFLMPLINFTADFTVTALQLTGIPVLREGTNFSIPSGNWSVVEACSGLRYLISSFTLGCLYAYLTYTTPKRRLIFILFSIVTPIIANGLRAYMIVMIGHTSGMTLAVGFDHLIYGWVFFGLVMFLMFWIGSFWRESFEHSDKNFAAPSKNPSAISTILIATVSVIFFLSLWPTYAKFLNRADMHPVEVKLKQFKSDWQDTANFTRWKPEFSPAYRELNKSYQKNTALLGMHLGYYRDQTRSATLIGSQNQLVKATNNDWQETESSIRSEMLSGKNIRLKESKIKGIDGTILVWQWYWIDDKFLINAYEGKFWQAKQKLMMRGDDGAVLVFYVRYDEAPEKARATIRDFLNTNLTALESTLRQSKKQSSGQ